MERENLKKKKKTRHIFLPFKKIYMMRNEIVLDILSFDEQFLSPSFFNFSMILKM